MHDPDEEKQETTDKRSDCKTLERISQVILDTVETTFDWLIEIDIAFEVKHGWAADASASVLKLKELDPQHDFVKVILITELCSEFAEGRTFSIS